MNICRCLYPIMWENIPLAIPWFKITNNTVALLLFINDLYLATTETALIVRLHLRVGNCNPFLDEVQSHDWLRCSFDFLVKSDGDFYLGADWVWNWDDSWSTLQLLFRDLSSPGGRILSTKQIIINIYLNCSSLRWSNCSFFFMCFISGSNINGAITQTKTGRGSSVQVGW